MKSMEMSDELKTLKDLPSAYGDMGDGYDIGDYFREYPDSQGNLIKKEELRQEAIKWIKHLTTQWHKEGHYGEHPEASLFIMHFFNITDEDLK